MISTDDQNIVTFCQALNEKYRPDVLDGQFDNIVISETKKKAVMKMQDHAARIYLSLDCCEISSSGDVGEISSKCPKIQDLDLSSNKFSDWKQILNIMQELKELKTLNVSHNPLSSSQVPKNINKESLPNLKTLVLNGIKMEFNTMLELLSMFPSLHDLHASLNNFGSIPPCDKRFESISLLYFVKNDITQWEEVTRLGQIFPCLKTLFISENPIEKICTSCDLTQCFPYLERLSMAKTLISSWQCLDQLRLFPTLTDIRLHGLPLWNDFLEEKQRLQLLIARLPNMKIINGGKIDDSEREDAERAFIRYYKNKTEKPTRYIELSNVHGTLHDLANVNMSNEEYVTVILKGDIEEEFLLKLNLSLTTKELKRDIGKRYNLQLSKFRLFFYNVDGGPLGGEEMYVNSRTLGRYFMKDGDSIELIIFDNIE